MSTTHRLAAAVVALATAAAPLGAHAQPAPTGDTAAERKKANALYKEGVRLFNAGQFADALDLFTDAYHRYPDARILFSIATTLRQIGRTVEAANAYQRFIADPGAEPQFVADSQTVLRVLDATVGTVTVRFDGPPGEVRAEDGDWLPAGTGVVRVEPGRFVVQARRDGFVADATGRVAAGAAVEVTLTWRAVAADPPPPPPPVAPPPTPPALPATAAPPPPRVDHGGRRLAGYLTGGGGLALVGAAVVLELGARGRIDDAEAACPGLTCAGDGYQRARALLDAADTRRTAATIAGIAGVAAIATGAALWWTARPHERAVRVAPLASPTSAGLTVATTF